MSVSLRRFVLSANTCARAQAGRRSGFSFRRPVRSSHCQSLSDALSLERLSFWLGCGSRPSKRRDARRRALPSSALREAWRAAHRRNGSAAFARGGVEQPAPEDVREGARDMSSCSRQREKRFVSQRVRVHRSTTPSLCDTWCSTRWTRTRATCSQRLRTTRSACHVQLRCRTAALTCAAFSRVLQATIYDNEHFGSYVAVVEQFVNEKTTYTAGGVRLPRAPPFPAE